MPIISKMQFSAIILFFMLVSQFAYSADFLDGFYNRLTQVFGSETCQNIGGPNKPPSDCAAGNNTSSNRESIQGISENVFYNRLSVLEKERLQCSMDEWDSYSNKTETGKINQEIMVAKINDILPDLQFLKNNIGKLVSETQLLRGKLPSNFETRQLTDPKYIAIKKEFDEKNEQAKQLMGGYELRISQIPNSDNPIVREFIEDKLSTFFSKKHEEVTAAEFEKVIGKVKESFSNSIKEIDKTQSNGQYNLSIKQQARLSSDPTLIGQLSRENPSAANSIPYLQCSAKNRLMTKELTELGANIASLAIPIGGLAVAKAARTAMVLRSPQLARGFELAAKGLGWAAMIGGGIQAANGVFNACFKDTTATVQGQCRQNPQTMIEKHERSTCMWEATLAAAPGVAKFGAGFLLKRVGDNSSKLSQFIQKMSGRSNLRSQDLAFAGSLKNEDRVIAAEGILAKRLSDKEKEALLKAHEVGGLKAFGQYTPEEIEEKRALLKAAGFSERETETLLWKGIAGYNRAEIAVLAQKRASEFFKKPISTDQVQAIMNDTEAAARGGSVVSARLQKLKDAGFTTAQAEEIMSGSLHRAGSVSRTVASTTSAAGNVPAKPVAGSQPAAAAKPAAPATASTTPAPAAPVPAPAPSAAEIAKAESEAIKKATGSSQLYDLSNNPKAGRKEVEAALAPEMKRSGYKATDHADYIKDVFDQDVEHIYKLQTKIETTKPGSPERANLERSINAYKARCKSWKTLYERANYSSTNLINHFTTHISRVCAD